MNDRLVELAVRRGVLMERIATQRAEMAANAFPLVRALGVADQTVLGLHWLRQRPGLVVGFVAGFAVIGPKRALRWGRRAFFMWSGVQGLRRRLRAMRHGS